MEQTQDCIEGSDQNYYLSTITMVRQIKNTYSTAHGHAMWAQKTLIGMIQKLVVKA